MIFLGHDLGETEVSEFDVTLVVDQNVVWLQVSVHDVVTMEALDGQNYLANVLASLAFCQPVLSMTFQDPREVPALTVF